MLPVDLDDRVTVLHSLCLPLRTGGRRKPLHTSCNPLNGERSAELVLDEGDSILVHIEKENGRLDLSVAGKDGEKIYTAHDVDSGEFILEAPPGIYTVNVQGKHAKGNLSFEVQKAP